MTSDTARIGDVARVFDMPASTLRYYERQGLLKPARDDSGQRSYSRADLRDLAFILMCRDGGLQLDEIAILMARTNSQQGPWQATVQARITAIENEITRLQQASTFLSNALRCQADHPAIDCPYVKAELDARISCAVDGP